MRSLAASLLLFTAACSSDPSSAPTDGAPVMTPDDGGALGDGGGGNGPVLKTVFLILLENHSWSSIKGNSKAPYLNGLLSTAAHAENYETPTANHPSEPNYIWLEAGSNLGVTDDNPPSSNHQSTTEHLVTQLTAKGISWRSYQESIDGKSCPLTDNGSYAVRHCPMLFFDDVTNNRDPKSQSCIDHVRPVGELTTDLIANKVAR